MSARYIHDANAFKWLTLFADMMLITWRIFLLITVEHYIVNYFLIMKMFIVQYILCFSHSFNCPV